VNDPGTAGAREPDIPVVEPAVQLAAPLVLRDEGHEGAEGVAARVSLARPAETASLHRGTATGAVICVLTGWGVPGRLLTPGSSRTIVWVA
jgi:hypothetical protein